MKLVIPHFFMHLGKSRLLPFCMASVKKICMWEHFGCEHPLSSSGSIWFSVILQRCAHITQRCPCNLPTNDTALVTLCWRHLYRHPQRRSRRFSRPPKRTECCIQFTKEMEENGELPFLDCLVSCNNNKLQMTVYRKPEHTNRLLDESSYNPTSHEATTTKTLTRRAQLVCDTPDRIRDEKRHLEHVFHKKQLQCWL